MSAGAGTVVSRGRRGTSAGRRAGERRRAAAVPQRTMFVLATVVVSAWALFQNFYRIGTAVIVADEPTYASAAWRYIHGVTLPPVAGGSALAITPDNFEHPPLAKFLFGLAQLTVGGPSVTADRVVSSTCTVLTGVVIAVWIGRAAGRWTGLLAAAFTTLLPEAASGSQVSFVRFGMLDPVAGFFAVLSLALAWAWFRRSGSEAWRYAALTGLAAGCATASKENGFLGIAGPVLVVLIAAARDRRALGVRVLQALAAGVLAVGVFVAFYVPLGHPIARIRYLMHFQSAHASEGHLIGFAGRVAFFPPWWTNFWFAGHGLGSALTVTLVVAAVLAVCLRRDALTWWCLAALAGPVVFHCFVAKVALGYYWVMWMPAFFILAALGFREVAELVRSRAGAYGPAAMSAVVAAALVVPAVSAGHETSRVAKLKPVGPQVLRAVMNENGLHGPIVAAGVANWMASYYLPGVPVLVTAAGPLNGADTVVIGAPQCRELIDPSVRALVAVNVRAGTLRAVHTDSTMTIYARTGTLVAPNAQQISAEPVGSLTDHC